MSTTSFITPIAHPTLGSLTTLLASTIFAGHHYREDIGLYILDQKYFIKLLKERAKSLARDFENIGMNASASTQINDYRIVEMRLLPALRAVEKEAEMRLEELTDLVTIARALEEAEDHESHSLVQYEEEDSPLGDDALEIVARPPLVIEGSEDLDVAIADAMREYRVNNELTNQEEDGHADSGLGSSDESGQDSTGTQSAGVVPRPPLVIQGSDDIDITLHDAMEQYRIDNEAVPAESVVDVPIHRHEVIEDEIDAIISDIFQQIRIDNETDLAENEDEQYDADTESANEATAIEPTITSETEADPLSRGNLVPTPLSIRTSGAPRFDSSAVPGKEGYVRTQQRWIDSQVAIDKA